VSPLSTAQSAVRKVSTAAEHPSSNDDGAGKPVVSKQGVLALERRQAGEDPKSQMPDRQDAAAGFDTPSSGARVGRADAAPARPDGTASDVTLHKEAVLRAGAPAGRQDAEKDPHATPRTDTPAAREQALRTQQADKPADRRGDAEARKLMLEDGVPERDAPPREEPDLGDLGL
jgi:hypothetical protein